MTELSSTENKPKKSVSRIITVALTIICVILIASTVTVITLLTNITQKYDQERTIAQCWDNDRAIPNNLDNLFPNKIVIWKNMQVTELDTTYVTFTFLNYFNYTGCLLINVTSSNTTIGDSIGVSWNATSPSTFPFQYRNITFTSDDVNKYALFPVLPSNSLDVFIGDFAKEGWTYNITQTVTLTYYYQNP